jgi:hypothetical protein
VTLFEDLDDDQLRQLAGATHGELRRSNEIALGLAFLAASLICQFTAITGSTIGR